jgi:hypothetical protein
MSHYGFVIEQLTQGTAESRRHRRRHETRPVRRRREDRSRARFPTGDPGASGA